MRRISVMLILELVALTGCESQDDAELQEAQCNFGATVEAQQNALQWQVDKSTA